MGHELKEDISRNLGILIVQIGIVSRKPLVYSLVLSKSRSHPDVVISQLLREWSNANGTHQREMVVNFLLTLLHSNRCKFVCFVLFFQSRSIKKLFCHFFNFL